MYECENSQRKCYVLNNELKAHVNKGLFTGRWGTPRR